MAWQVLPLRVTAYFLCRFLMSIFKRISEEMIARMHEILLDRYVYELRTDHISEYYFNIHFRLTNRFVRCKDLCFKCSETP